MSSSSAESYGLGNIDQLQGIGLSLCSYINRALTGTNTGAESLCQFPGHSQGQLSIGEVPQ